MSSSDESTVVRLEPGGLHQAMGYAHGVLVRGPARTIYVGGQNAVDAAGNLIGEGDLRAQSAQALRNVEAVLLAGGATVADVVKMTICIVSGGDVRAGFQAFRDTWGDRAAPAAVSVLIVAGLARPGCLVEIDAIAAVPEGR